MVIVYSATKGLAAMTLARRPLARLARLRRARLRATGRSSRSRARSASPSGSSWRTRRGCSRSTSPSIASVVADLDRLAVVLARQKPAWEPGTRQAYHALTLGFYEGELLRRVDPQHRSLGQFFQDEIAVAARARRLHPPARVDPELPAGDACAAQPARHAARVPDPADAGGDESPLEHLPGAHRQSRVRDLSTTSSASTRATSRCRPAAASAPRGRSRMPTACSRPAAGSCGLRPETLDLLAAPAIPPTRGFYDECLRATCSSRWAS